MSYIAGIDVDTKAIHCVFVDENDLERPEYISFNLQGQDAWERVRDVKRVLRPYSWDDVLAIGLENPAGRSGTGLYAVMRTTGAVLTCLPEKVLVQPWRPGEWRKAVGLPGNASKAVVAHFAVNDVVGNNEFRDWPQDACDAYCIALATRQAIELQAA